MERKPRLLQPEDAPAFRMVRHKMLEDTPPAFLSSPEDDRMRDPQAFLDVLNKPENEILAIFDEEGEDPSRIVATAGVMRLLKIKTRHRADIWGVFCDPEFRGRGYGRAVVEAAIDTARGWPGVEAISLSVSAGTQAALALYKSLGFATWGREPDSMRVDGISFDEIHMQLRL